ncbi:MAG: hypothetical protein Q9163_003161 [Psora crenata]
MAFEPQYLTGDKAGIEAFVDKFDVFLFDCDAHPQVQLSKINDRRRVGVLWSGDRLFEGTVETLDKLRSKGKKIVFVTNNSTKSRADYQKKLTGIGIPATLDEVFSSSYSSAIYISRILSLPPSKNKVYILGESGIETELRSEKIHCVGGSDPLYRRDIAADDYQKLASGEALDKAVGAVLCGLDFHLNYLKLAFAYHYITQNNAVFLATNSDVTLPNENALFPGAGACAAPLVAMLGGMKPEELGKPSQKMMDAVQSKFHFERERACMVGDRLDTDIKFGIEGKLGGTLCVLTGVTKAKEDWEAQGVVKPAAWVNKLGDLTYGL